MAEMLSALARVRTTRGDDLLPDSMILQWLGAAGVVWRERLLPPAVTARLFLMQILFGNTSITHSDGGGTTRPIGGGRSASFAGRFRSVFGRKMSISRWPAAWVDRPKRRRG